MAVKVKASDTTEGFRIVFSKSSHPRRPLSAEVAERLQKHGLDDLAIIARKRLRKPVVRVF